MSYTMPNPYNYRSPIGEALANLTQTMMSGPNQAQKIAQAEQALALKMKREGTESVADMFGQYGTPGFDRNAVMRGSVFSGYDPSEMERYGAANTFGAMDPRTDNAFVGAGGAYSSTGGGFRADQGRQERQHGAGLLESARQFDMKPQEALIGGQPGFVPQSGAFDSGVAPIMSEADQKGTLLGSNWSNLNELMPEQQRVLGADATAGNRAPFNYRSPDGSMAMTVDGVTDVHGNPLQPGGSRVGLEDTVQGAGLTTATTSGVQQQTIANEQFESMLGIARDLAADPNNFGVTGWVKGTAQDVVQLAENLSSGLGYNGLSDAVATIQAELAGNDAVVNPTILSGIFDPSLPALQTVADLLAYSAASALAGQSGRSVSDRDIAIFKRVVGNPQSFFASQRQFLSKLDEMERMVRANQGVLDKAIGGGQQTHPLAPAAPGQEEVWDYVDGVLQRVQ